jgi:hypothetical protein
VSATHSTAETEPSTPAAGTVVTVKQRPTPFGDIAKEVETQVAAKVDGDWRTYATPDGTAGEYETINASASDFAAVQSVLTTRSTAGDNTSLGYGINEDGTFRIRASYRPPNTRIALSSTSWDLGTKTQSFPAFAHSKGIAYLAFTVSTLYTTTGTAAWTHQGTSLGGTYQPEYRGHRSEVRHVGQNRWMSVRVETA